MKTVQKPGITLRLDDAVQALLDDIVSQSDGLLDRSKAIRWAIKLAAKTMARRLEAMNSMGLDEEDTKDKTPSKEDLDAARAEARQGRK